MSAPRPLLHVGPDPAADGLAKHLEDKGWSLTHARSLRAAAPLLSHGNFGVALLRLDAIGREQLPELEACREAADACEWVALLKPGALASTAARELVLRHCFDHHTEPADWEFLSQSLGHALGRSRLRTGRAGPGAEHDFGLAGRSAAIAQMRRAIRKAAASDACMVIEGETGTGKELAARAVHALSDRRDEPFVVVDCAAIACEGPEFFEQAAGGTLFLDHVSELPLDWQGRLVRFLAERRVRRDKLGAQEATDVRVIGATETPLSELTAAKQFRQDLFYRLQALHLVAPPLRERHDDALLLAEAFLAGHTATSVTAATGFTRPALAAIRSHDWPGNVRELANRVHQAALLAQQRLIGPEDLGLAAPRLAPTDSLDTIRVQAERQAISLTLDRFSHNVSLAARELGVSRMTLYRLMAKHAIRPG